MNSNEPQNPQFNIGAVSGSAYGNESKATYLKALDLHYKLSREQMDLVWKAMDGYGDYRAREAVYEMRLKLEIKLGEDAVSELLS
jgi:hypothetical protein